MRHRRSVMEVKLNLDGMPGWGHRPEDHVELISSALRGMPYYNPEVRLVRVEDEEAPTMQTGSAFTFGEPEACAIGEVTQDIIFNGNLVGDYYPETQRAYIRVSSLVIEQVLRDELKAKFGDESQFDIDAG